MARPFIDGALLRADRALWFDWTALFNATAARPHLAAALRFAYDSEGALAVAVIFFAGCVDAPRAVKMLIANAAVLLVAVGISGLWPAAGPAVTLHANVDLGPGSYWGLIEAARAGSWAPHLAGIIVFPSYHAALAILIIAAAPRAIVVILSLCVIAAIPAIGGHYLTDLIAGVALATACWAACGPRPRDGT
jgi:hypothetical protein